MKILLPPSEGKTAPDSSGGNRLNLDSLVFPELREARSEVMASLSEVSAAEDAQSVLKVGAKAMAEVGANTQLSSSPTAEAWQIYTGVLYEALGASSLSEAELSRAAEDVLIFSGLFGVTGFGDRIPVYRCSMDVKLPGLGNLGTYWKKQLVEPMDQLVGDQLVVDCRSGSYQKTWPGPPKQVLQVNSFTEKDGQRKVVTHFAKHARGELTGLLLRQPRPAETIDDVAEVAAQRWTVEIRPAEGRKPHQLDLVSK